VVVGFGKIMLRRFAKSSSQIGMDQKGSGIVLAIMFFQFWDFLWICCSVRFPCNLQHFGATSCHFNGIATFWSSNLSFSMTFATFW
jgi:hypothetical protein